MEEKAYISTKTKIKQNLNIKGRWLHLWNSWNHCFFNLNMKFRSRSFRVVYWSISVCGLPVVRPIDEPFRSKRLWIELSEQNRFPIMTKRTWVVVQQQTVRTHIVYNKR
jgi:hypothetical protein